MSQHEEEMELVDVRELWKYEAHDFTPWLARNLGLLGDALGIRLENPRTEVPVGPLRLDILAEEAETGSKVAIENQLEWTDTHHMGQLVTYASWFDARVVIWVAPEFRYEYAKALHRLNEWTRDGIKFYGVKVEALRSKGDTGLEPRFSKVVYPGSWNKDNTLPQDPPMPERQRKYHEFFQHLLVDLAEVEE